MLMTSLEGMLILEVALNLRHCSLANFAKESAKLILESEQFQAVYKKANHIESLCWLISRHRVPKDIRSVHFRENTGHIWSVVLFNCTDLCLQDLDGRTALHYVACWGDLEVARLILACGGQGHRPS